MNGYLIIILMLGLILAGCRKGVSPVVPDPPPVDFTQAPSAIIPPEPRFSAETTGTPEHEILADSKTVVEETQSDVAAPQKFFTEAERYFADGNYKLAIQAYEKFLNTFPKAAERDLALLNFGFSLALSGSDKDLLQTEIALRRLITEFPQSTYRRQAELILNLKTRIEQAQTDVKERDARILQLSEELRKLKSIDFDRRPSRPE